MSDTYKGAHPLQFNDKGKGMKKPSNKSFGVEHGAFGQEGGKSEPEHDYNPDDDHQAKSDADTLHNAEMIKGDTDRHQKAAYHLAKRHEAAKSAHKQAQKQMHQKVRKGLNKAFGGGETFGSEQAKEQGEAEKIVREE